MRSFDGVAACRALRGGRAVAGRSLGVSPAALLAVGVLLAGCQAESAGTPTAAPSTSGNEGSEAERPVAEPLDPAPFADRPCDLLPEEWLNKEGFGEGELGLQSEGSVGPGCSWDAGDVDSSDDRSLQLLIAVKNQERGAGGLRPLREQIDRMGGYYEPLEIGGYPAAFNDTRDNRSDGDLRLSVAIQDDLVFSILAIFYWDDPDRAPVDAKAAAEQVVTMLQGAQ